MKARQINQKSTGFPTVKMLMKRGYTAGTFRGLTSGCAKARYALALRKSLPTALVKKRTEPAHIINPSTRENVFMDTTCAAASGLIERAIRRLGADRFIWGTDVPYGNFVSEFFKLISLQISDEDKQKILWDNPMRIYRL